MRRAVAVVSFLLSPLSACHRSPPGQGDEGALVALAPAEDEIVATVSGRPIRISDVVAQARASGKPKRVALEALIDGELLAGLALERGLLADPDVVQARRAEEVRRLLATDFEPQTPVERVPEADQRKAYDKNRLYFDRDEAVEVWHLVALASSKDAPEQRQRAKAQLEAMRPQAVAVANDAAFSALADEHPPAGRIAVKAEQITFPRRGVVEDSFADAAFALTTPGQLSEVVETSYGYHLIRLVKRMPPRHVAFADAHAELQKFAHPAWQKREFDRYVRDLIERWGAEVHPDRLVEAKEAQP